MGPGPRGPGNEPDRPDPGQRLHGFNGAGTARSRKWLSGHWMFARYQASMGPGPRGPGNSGATGDHSKVFAASMGPGPRGPGNAASSGGSYHNCGASMGPGPRGPGNRMWAWMNAERGIASMGPGPRGPGNIAVLDGQGASTESLQWGRDRAVPEMIQRPY